MNPKVITLTTTDWTKIEYNDTSDQHWFSFWADNDIEFAEIPTPAIWQSIPLTANTRFIFKKPVQFWVKWTIGTEITLAPFDK